VPIRGLLGFMTVLDCLIVVLYWNRLVINNVFLKCILPWNIILYYINTSFHILALAPNNVESKKNLVDGNTSQYSLHCN